MDTVYVVLSISCSECGRSKSVSVLDHKPSKDEIKKNELVAGGMWCIYSYVVECGVNGEPREVNND